VVTLLLLDAIGSALAWRFVYLLRIESGIFTVALPAELIGPTLLLTGFWWAVFAIRGLYRSPIALSRFEQIDMVFRAALVGTLVLYIATFDAAAPIKTTRLFLMYYGLLVFVFIVTFRILHLTFRRRQRSKGKGLWNAVIVGYDPVGHKLHEQLHNYPIWGFRVVGYVDEKWLDGEHYGKKILGRTADLPDIVKTNDVQWILVACEDEAEKVVAHVLDVCSDLKLRFMLVADQYQMVIGLVRTIEIHGLPLIEVQQHLVTPGTRFVKRAIDTIFGLIMSLVVIALTPIIGLAIKLDTSGPIFYSQNRLGRRGRIFRVYKYRSMIQDAEKDSGAIWAQKNDPRVTRVGRILRKTHLDELPQFFNVLRGQMSLVGPRPERPQIVEELRHKIPFYERRLRVRPGITGWAQVRHKYDESIEDVVEKTRYDLFYIDHISIDLDLKIILSTIVRMIRGGGHS
jgi:exopolysaccharide biosynthesis polyprenyl glycosylphosphotransferase